MAGGLRVTLTVALKSAPPPRSWLGPLLRPIVQVAQRIAHAMLNPD